MVPSVKLKLESECFSVSNNYNLIKITDLPLWNKIILISFVSFAEISSLGLKDLDQAVHKAWITKTLG